MKKFLIVAALVFGLGVIFSSASVLYPSIVSPVRNAILDEIDVLTNSPALSPEETRQLRLLKQSQRNIDRRGRATLFGDIQILASLTTTLPHAFPEGEFDPLLQQAIFEYSDVLLQSAFDLQTTLADLPPSTSSTLASNAVNDAILSVGQLDVDTAVPTGISILTRASSRLRSAETFATRARSTVSSSSRMNATVDGHRFTASPASISAIYSPGSQTLTLVGRETGGAVSGNSSIQIVLSGVVPGTTSYSLGTPGTGSYATYTATTPTNSIGVSSLSGNVLVTLNLTSGQASGRFSFQAGDPFSGQDRVRVTGGDFAIRLPTF